MSRAREWINQAAREKGEPPEPPRRGNGSGGEPPLGPRPLILVEPGKRHIAADQGLDALVLTGTRFYRRFTDLVQVVKIEGKAANGEPTSAPGVMPINLPFMLRSLAQAAVWQKPKARGFALIDPPEPVAKQILAMIEDWRFPVLRGVIATPTLRYDGSVLDHPGYDERTGLYLVEPPEMPPIPNAPTMADASDALAVLNDLLEDFAFAKTRGEDDEEEHDGLARSAAVSMLMTPVLRGMMNVAPMHAVTKPAAGTGGSYLCDMAAMIATGERCPVLTVTADRDETEKRLHGAALAGQPIIALDNVDVELQGDFLCQLIEQPRPQIRRLGASELFTPDNTWSTFANGNQLQIRGDLVRRTIAIGLDANLENPDDRTFSRDPLSEIQRDRGRYIAACLTIARAYITAGRPGRLPATPSFGEWSDNIRSALHWLNWQDPLGGARELRAADPNRRLRSLIFDTWDNTIGPDTGYLTRELVSEAAQHGELHNAFAEIALHKNGAAIDPQRLGQWLNKNLGAVAFVKNPDGTTTSLKLLVDRSDAARPRWKIKRAIVGVM